jgi:hypothetical protein
MRVLIIVCVIFVGSSCNDSSENTKTEKQVDSIKQQLTQVYTPGLGEFMSTIQLHHAKLWYAGINGNWELADFEMHEIGETVEAIKQYCTDRPETKLLVQYLPSAVNGVNQAIQQKNLQLFRERFLLLTNSCNDCHKANSFGFNVVTIPNAPPVSNQDFKKTN